MKYFTITIFFQIAIFLRGAEKNRRISQYPFIKFGISQTSWKDFTFCRDNMFHVVSLLFYCMLFRVFTKALLFYQIMFLLRCIR